METLLYFKIAVSCSLFWTTKGLSLRIEGSYRTWEQRPAWALLEWNQSSSLYQNKQQFPGFHTCEFQTYSSLLNINLLVGMFLNKKVFSNSRKHQSNESTPTPNNLLWCEGSISSSQDRTFSLRSRLKWNGASEQHPLSGNDKVMRTSAPPTLRRRLLCWMEGGAWWPLDLLPILRLLEDPLWQQANETTHLFKITSFIK